VSSIHKLSLHKITLLPELESILFLKTLDPTCSQDAISGVHCGEGMEG
jgi:hypothetical protein